MKISKIAIPILALSAIGFVSTTTLGHTVSNRVLVSATCGEDIGHGRMWFAVADTMYVSTYSVDAVKSGRVGRAELDQKQAEITEKRHSAMTHLTAKYACQRYTTLVYLDERQQLLNEAYKALN